MLTASQVAELYSIHNALFALHERATAITNDVHDRGLVAGKVLEIQCAITDALCNVSDAISENVS